MVLVPVLELVLPLLFAWLAQLELRQHLQPRDFLPDDVSELSSVDAVDIGCCGAVAVPVVGCRQHEEDFVVTVVGVAVVVVVVAPVTLEAAGGAAFVDSFSLPCVVFNIFSSGSPVEPCWEATAHRGHSPTLNGCSSLL